MSAKKVNTGRAPEQDAVRRNAIIGDQVFFGLLITMVAMIVGVVLAIFQ